MEANLSSTIVDILEKSGRELSANDVLKQLKVTNDQIKKADVNKILYQLFDQKKVTKIEGSPPRWLVKSENNNIEVVDNTNNSQLVDLDNEEGILTHVFIDVDNSPCLKEASVYAKDNVHIWSYASPNYNNYKPETTQNLNFVQASNDQVLPSVIQAKFAMLITKITQFYTKSQFILVSKDKFLHTLVKLHYNEFGINYQIITQGWQELKLLLE